MYAGEVRVLGIVGAGQMGAGIAEVAARSGLAVVLSDVDAERAAQGRRGIAARLEARIAKGKMAESEADALLERITPVGGIEALAEAEADFVIEAATEALQLKLELLAALDRVFSSADVVLATNTSSIPITRLAASTARPDRVIGMHFMNPVPVMALVEIVRGLATSQAAYEGTCALAERLGKRAVASKDRPGFVVNRMLLPFLNEACFALEEGVASVDVVDEAAKLGLGHPMGPLELADTIGLDTVLAIADVLHREFGDDKYRAPVLLRTMVAAGWLGRKAGRGFYVYDERGAKKGSSLP